MAFNAPLAGAVLLLGAVLAPAVAAETGADAVARGEYIFHAAGCFGCHTDVKGKGAPLAGGRVLKTPFGTFFGPNITPDKENGIGGWTLEQFTKALRKGIAPGGRSYYPTFPYPSFAGMTDDDVADLWVYLSTVEPAPRANDKHKLGFPYSWRRLNGVWKALYFAAAPFDPGAPPAGIADAETWRRGAYLVSALVHCGECHSPRGALGAMRQDKFLAGNPKGPEGKPVPNITPHRKRGIGGWSEGDIVTYLEMGMDPDGDFAGGAMAEIIDHSTAKLTAQDRRAIAVYLASLPALVE